LEWHKTQGGADIVSTINSVGPFDLMGFQECDNISAFLNQIKGASYAAKQGPQDIAVAWNTAKFSKVSEGDAVVGHDGWGNRDMHWVRLSITGTSKFVVFANTHGPVNQCSGEYEDWKNVAHAYVSNSLGAMKDGDHLFFTGDFNCGATPIAAHNPHGDGVDQIMTEIRKSLTDIGQASYFYPALYQPDRIWVKKGSDTYVKDWTPMCCTQPGTCEPHKMLYDDPEKDQSRCVAQPSDHMLLRAHVQIPTSSSTKLISV